MQFPFKRLLSKDGPLKGEAEGRGDLDAYSAPTVMSILQTSGMDTVRTRLQPEGSESPEIRVGTDPHEKYTLDSLGAPVKGHISPPENSCPAYEFPAIIHPEYAPYEAVTGALVLLIISEEVNTTLSNGFTAPAKESPYDSKERPENDCPKSDKRPLGPEFPVSGLREGVGDDETSSCPTTSDAPQTSGNDIVRSALQPRESIPPLSTCTDLPHANVTIAVRGFPVALQMPPPVNVIPTYNPLIMFKELNAPR